MSLELYFLSCSCSTSFPPLPFRHFLHCMCQQQHRHHYFKHKNVTIGAHDKPFGNLKHHHFYIKSACVISLTNKHMLAMYIFLTTFHMSYRIQM